MLLDLGLTTFFSDHSTIKTVTEKEADRNMYTYGPVLKPVV